MERLVSLDSVNVIREQHHEGDIEVGVEIPTNVTKILGPDRGQERTSVQEMTK